jgi:hypothetical protein
MMHTYRRTGVKKLRQRQESSFAVEGQPSRVPPLRDGLRQR